MPYNFKNIKLNQPYTRRELCAALEVEPKASGKAVMTQISDIKRYCLLDTIGKGKGMKYIVKEVYDNKEINVITNSKKIRKGKYIESTRLLLLNYFQHQETNTLNTTLGTLASKIGILNYKEPELHLSKKQYAFIQKETIRRIKLTIEKALNSLQELSILQWEKQYYISKEGHYNAASQEELEKILVVQKEVANKLDCTDFRLAFVYYPNKAYELFGNLIEDKYNWNRCELRCHIDFYKDKVKIPITNTEIIQHKDKLRNNLATCIIKQQTAKIVEFTHKECFGEVKRNKKERTEQQIENIEKLVKSLLGMS